MKINIRKCSHRDSKWMFETTINGKRIRKFFATKELAEEGREIVLAEIARNGRQLSNLSTQLRLQALEAQQLLDPLGASLMDAVKFYLQAHDMRSKSVTIREAWEGGDWNNDTWQSYKAKCEAKVAGHQLKPKSFECTRYWIPRFVEDFGAKLICDVESLAIEKWLGELTKLNGKPVATETRKTGRLQLSGFFTHAVRMGWINEDPVKNGKIEIPFDREAATKLPGIFQIEETARLLEHAPEHLVPYVAIGAFCGIRPAELHRLEWSDIKWESRQIHVSARQSKTAQRRDVTMPDNLLEWLAPYRQATGKLVDQTEAKTKYELRKVSKAAGIAKWPQDGLRHSFASYHLALHRNSTLTSAEMGHMTPTLVWKKYNHHRAQEEGKAFFAIRPQADNVIALSRVA